MELSPTTRRRQFSSAITAPTKTILAIMALFRVSLGVSRLTISTWETGAKKPMKRRQVRLSEFLGLEVEEMIGLMRQPQMPQ